MKTYNGEKAVISLTTWKKRVDTVYKTIRNLIDTCSGFHICLTLSIDEFPQKEKDLPLELVDNKDIEILWVKENTRAFKKILHTIAKYPTVPVIAADDDCFYTENYAQRLYDAWLSNDKIYQIYTYHVDQNCWPYRFGNGPACLYPPSCFGQYGLKLLTQAIVDTNHDDLYYGTLAFKLHIPIVEVAKRRPYEFHDEIEGLSSTKIGDGIACLKICISEIDNVINKL